MAGIIVKETVVEKDPTIISEVVVLPGIKGEKGDPFTYDDFTPEQIAELQRPATEAAAVANQAAGKANKAASDIKVLGDKLTAEEAKRESAESSRASAESERAKAETQREESFSKIQTSFKGIISDANTAISNATTAAGNAENAASEANTSAANANQAAAAANQAAQNVDGRVTSLEGKASQVYENLAAIEASGETNVNKIYIDGDTLISYLYKGGRFVPFGGGKPKGGYNRALFEAAGAIFNEDTGYYELYADEGGLTDITEDEMYDIYTQTAHLAAISGEIYNLFSLTCRTNFKGRIFGNKGINELYVYGSEYLEVLFLKGSNSTYNQSLKVSNLKSEDFYMCNRLKKVIGVLDLTNVGKVFDSITYILNIEDIKISRLKTNLNIFNKDSVINYESIKYLVDNAANTSAITITVHPTTYGYLTGTIQPTEQVGGTTEEWKAIVTTAAEKQITFATTE